MGKWLFVTEKPSVAMEFVKLLNVKGIKADGYIESDKAVFTWCVGHLVTMSYPEAYDENLKRWSLSTLPFLPKEYKYEVIPAVKKQFNTVANLLKREDIDRIYVCTDSGREGEYIYRLVDKIVGVEGKEKKRVWIDSQTEEEIRRGISEAKDLSEYDSLAHSAFLRAKEDYLVGINFSRLLTLIYGKTISNFTGEDRVVIAVGRVMSCVLGMIVEREREIRGFVKTPFYKVIGEFNVGDNELELTYDGEWKAVEGSEYFQSHYLYNESGFKRREDAEKLVEKFRELSKSSKIIIDKITKNKEIKKAPLLFNLAELQNECSKKFKISPEETLNKVQSLYEKKMLTYPRTDARVLSKAVSKEIGKNIRKLTSYKGDSDVGAIAETIVNNNWFKDLEKTKYVDDSKITDHYAIIPTGEGLQSYEKLNDLEKKIYNLVVRRFLSIFYPPAKYNKIEVVTKVGNESFFTSDKVCVERGYLDVLNWEKDSKENKKVEFLNKLRKGQVVDLNNLTIKNGETTPPKRYTGGSIIIAMENAGKLIEDEELREQIKGAGIGTSATRAEILKKLEKIQYIASNKKTQIITPTTKGEMIYEVIKASIPTLLNPTLTASWEKGLKMVYQREITPEIFMDKLENYTRTNIHKVLSNNKVVNGENLFSEVIESKNITIAEKAIEDVLGICPICSKGQIVKNKKGYGCTNWSNGCKFFVSEICGKKISTVQIKKIIERGRTDIIKGFKSKKGTDFDAALILKEGKIQFDFSK
ncbi:DNA topoisomerase [Clostridium sp. CX1]|uniref:DNA topoisomerase n=1 Tax=Clostridium tanneri TaxID=3037988 RepID=A0ABU4JVY2_9CLOT|nr:MULTISPECIES: type IA DNA topoisomerase [unclassified Clostridium]MCT8977134.1 DNA topoisomerase [Clostridium sp. CX1]MDW8802312.1 DNA topoisomerase [Clostridium sp. A1-XYC3]